MGNTLSYDINFIRLINRLYPSRSLENLIADNSAFLKETTGKKEAAKFNNALHTPLLQIELEKVSPPYLHILLGVVLKHHKLLEDSAHTLDTEIAGQEDQFLTDFGKVLKKYGANWKLWEELEQKIRFEQGCVVFSQTQSDIDKHTANLDMAQNALDDLTHIPLKPRSGPIASALDPALDRHRITPQAYHNRALVGNHCNKYLQENVYTDITSTILTQTQALTNKNVIERAAKIQQCIQHSSLCHFSHKTN